jgi:hypothetical protein
MRSTVSELQSGLAGTGCALAPGSRPAASGNAPVPFCEVAAWRVRERGRRGQQQEPDSRFRIHANTSTTNAPAGDVCATQSAAKFQTVRMARTHRRVRRALSGAWGKPASASHPSRVSYTGGEGGPLSLVFDPPGCELSGRQGFALTTLLNAPESRLCASSVQRKRPWRKPLIRVFGPGSRKFVKRDDSPLSINQNALAAAC